MEFMFLIVHPKDPAALGRWPWRDGETPGPASDAMSAMGEYAADLRRREKLKGGAPLHAATGAAHVLVRGGETLVSDGPFPETKELVGGIMIVGAASRDEAIEIARACPHVQDGVIDVFVLPERDVFRADAHRKYVFLLHEGLDEADPDGSKFREMVAYDDELKERGAYLESSQLAHDPPGARIDARGGTAFVTDGPFAESREQVGGYYVVEAASRDEAIALATRCPHAKWGRVEVREMMKPSVPPPPASR